MKSGWKEVKLEEVIEKFIDYRGKTPKKTPLQKNEWVTFGSGSFPIV